MTKRLRLIILLICVALFFLIVPYILLYSLGYRIDFESQRIVATGGVYVRVFPTGADISVDNAPATTTGYFYNSVFVQNLIPGTHQISINKEGYFDYHKSLPVEENEVTKLENVTLFKKDTVFFPAPDATIAMAQHTSATSPDSQKTVLWDAKNIMLVDSHSPEPLYTSTQKIQDVFWLNNDYLIFSVGSSIIISEIDTRGNTNTVTLNQKADRIFFNQQDKKLYLKNQNSLLISDRLLP